MASPSHVLLWDTLSKGTLLPFLADQVEVMVGGLQSLAPFPQEQSVLWRAAPWPCSSPASSPQTALA